ncbi:bifunctional diguanylate cyclase/phosphodiesterase [Oricola thermophila]|uniref:bifunctional diguanylate cyclase/phosphodiesterase n=1 Tax=Oricola thermophila TaxID=2742145 RepID=UPI001FE2DF6B|nr:EAL domain-containing protein [Oricola thermophila]
MDQQNRAVHHQSSRSHVAEQLGIVRARLEGSVNANIQLIRGLVAVIATQPDMDQERFSEIASGLLGDHSQLRNIAAAPGMVISMMYPLEGNEKAIGLDYRKNELQREAALRAVETGDMVLAGPVELLQGGQGFIGRFPVFLEVPGNSRELWGLVSAVVDAPRLYADSGLLADDLQIDIAISGKDARLADRTAFFGKAEVFDSQPVQLQVSLPSGSWRIAAIPRGGWNDTPENVWQVRGIILMASILVILPISVAGYLFDQRKAHVRELRLRQNQMQRLSQRLKLALDTSRIGVWEFNLDTRELSWDARMRELYGIDDDADNVDFDVWTDAIHPDDREQAQEAFRHAIETRGTFNSDFRIRTEDGTTRWIRAIGAVHNDVGRQNYIVGVNWDVSADFELKMRLMSANRSTELRNRELEDARSQMEHNSLHDSLTGLPNRRFLDQRLMAGGNEPKPAALLHIDLDRFKQINDTLGHAAGDAMLVHAASILKANTRDTDFVARVGGDEFVIATVAPTDEARLSSLASRIIEEMRQPVAYQDHTCRFGVSIGIAVADTSVSGYGKRLLVDADIALYRAKSNGRNRFEFFSSSLKAEIVRNKRVADDILGGLEGREFVPWFQPQFDAATLEIVGVEALARWEHPKEGILAPDAFMRIADELNVVALIDRTILEQALWASTRWKAAGLSIPKMSVNVSAGRLHDADLMSTLDGLSIEPGTVSFELLESIFLDDENKTIAGNFEQLRARGIDIEIDDFGTGYASIVSLVHLQPKRLKIDRQLITPIIHSDRQRRLVASIIDIGRSLGINIVAEGVETMRHAEILRDLGCDALQGYAFAAPMSSGSLIEFVREERWRQVA